ncbi:unnamed protein product [Amoebophrya sp. A25]|nr:unnamed protein product [Amoebophrya sp. A25]|eukprot:GSA25T00017520001.1
MLMKMTFRFSSSAEGCHEKSIFYSFQQVYLVHEWDEWRGRSRSRIAPIPIRAIRAIRSMPSQIWNPHQLRYYIAAILVGKIQVRPFLETERETHAYLVTSTFCGSDFSHGQFQNKEKLISTTQI